MSQKSTSPFLQSVAEYAAFNRAEKEIASSLTYQSIERVQNLIYELLTTNPDFYICSKQDENFCSNFYKQHSASIFIIIIHYLVAWKDNIIHHKMWLGFK